MSKPVIAITMGDPGGIGPEIIMKALALGKLPASCHYKVIGARKVFEDLKEKIKADLFLCKHEPFSGKGASFLDISQFCPSSKYKIGKVSSENGQMARTAIDQAAILAAKGLIQGIVTAPVNKAAIRLIDKNFIGHTEFFAQKAGIKRFAMMFISPRLKVTLVTIHVPLKKVSGLLNRAMILEKILLTEDVLKRALGLARPKIAVCALNPHGQETGREEAKVIVPAVRQAQRKGICVSGPYAADQLFYQAYHGRYDALISMYHDQALGPFKMIAFQKGINMTLGLPYVRTSPDHGTAFDLAGLGKADASSMISAIRLASNLVFSRYAHTN